MINSMLANLKVKFHSVLTYAMLALVFVIILAYVLSLGEQQQETYLDLFKNDFFLWIVFTIAITAINKAELSTVSCFNLARVGSKAKRFINNMLTILISTIIFTVTIFLLGFLAQTQFRTNEMQMDYPVIVYLFTKYVSIAILVQVITYVIIHRFPVLRKFQAAVAVIPFILYISLTLPYEFIGATSMVTIPWLNFSAMGLTAGMHDSEVRIVHSLIGNLHILVLIIAIILLYDWFYLAKEEYYL